MCLRENTDSNFVIPDALPPLLARFRRESSGQDLIEYALLAAMIVLAAVFSLNTLSAAIRGRYTTVASQLDSGTAAPPGGSASSTGYSETPSGSASGTSTPSAASGDSGGLSSTSNSNSGNSGNHFGGGNNGNGRGNADP